MFTIRNQANKSSTRCSIGNMQQQTLWSCYLGNTGSHTLKRSESNKRRPRNTKRLWYRNEGARAKARKRGRTANVYQGGARKQGRRAPIRLLKTHAGDPSNLHDVLAKIAMVPHHNSRLHLVLSRLLQLNAPNGQTRRINEVDKRTSVVETRVGTATRTRRGHWLWSGLSLCGAHCLMHLSGTRQDWGLLGRLSYAHWWLTRDGRRADAFTNSSFFGANKVH